MMRGRLSGRWTALALVWAGAVFWASSQPSPFLVPSAFLSHDKLLHAAAYAVLAALVRGALAPARLGAVRAAVLAAAIAIAYGASDELHQTFVPGRSADPRDLAADGIGAIVGAAAAAALLSRRGARQLAGQGDAG